jgi:hypothetical protein
LKSKNNKKWWDTVKQLAGYPKKQVPLSIVSEGRTISGNELAEKINATFVSVTKHLDPLYSTPVGIQHEIDYPEIPPELIISEIKFIANYPQFQSRRVLTVFLTGS